MKKTNKTTSLKSFESEINFTLSDENEEFFETPILMNPETGEEIGSANLANGVLRTQEESDKKLAEGKKKKAIADSMKLLNQ